ncbi:hypothetical protein C8R48DRAFT_777421 [Suillus tomentosus]|nr:hypothetical protein C8R48DRAFT_777421 [Suillus tomentosus]
MTPTKKKGRAKAPRQNTIVETSTPATTGLPALHITDNGRFGLQDQLIPSEYVGSEPLLQSHQALPEPNLTTGSVVQSSVGARTTHSASRSGAGGAGRGPGRGASRGAAQGAAQGAARGISHSIFHSDLQPDVARVSNVQCHVGACAVSHSPQVSNQRSESSIMTPHALPDIASSASRLFADDGSDGADGEIDEDGMGVNENGMGIYEDGMGVDEDMGVNEDSMGIDEDGIGIDEDDIGFEEEDIGIEEEDIGIEEDDIGVEENGDNDMDYDDYGDEDIMYTSDHNGLANSGNNQVRHSATQIPDPGAEDEDEDNTAAACVDHNQQNCVQHRPGQAEKRANRTMNVDKDCRRHGTTKAAHSNALATVNCRPRSPSPTYLNSLRNQYPKSKHTRTGNSPDDIDDQYKDSEDNIYTGRKRCNARKKGDVANPTTLGFFPHLWGKLLNYAKANFRLYLAISVPFPTKEDALSSVCSESIMEAIVHWQDQKCQVKKGYYPKYKREMAIVTQVYNDAATFRSWIKQVTLAIVPLKYRLALLQGNTIASVKMKASGLLKKTNFLCGDRDAEGRTSNFANNALRTVCHKVYYDSGSKLLRQFPAFQKTIPPKALILVTTIRGQVMGAKQTSIPDSEAAYESISVLYERVNKDLYHGPKLRQMLQSWAVEGLNTHGTALGDEGHNTSDWDIELD